MSGIDRWIAAIREIVKDTVADRVRYIGIYDYVVGSSSPNFADCTPADQGAGLPNLKNAPIITGIPGATVVLSSQAHVGVCFLDGSPAKPRVVLFDSTAALSVTLNTSTGTAEHLTTIEGVCAVLEALGPLATGAGSPAWIALNVDTAVANAAASGILPTTVAAIKTALANKGPDATGLQPSVGCPNLLGG